MNSEYLTTAELFAEIERRYPASVVLAAGPTIRDAWISRARVVEVVWCTDQANALYTAEDAQ